MSGGQAAGEFDEARANEEIVFMRGLSGHIWAMALPLPEPIADQAAKGELVRVNADGSPWETPDDGAEQRPAPRKTSRPRKTSAD